MLDLSLYGRDPGEGGRGEERVKWTPCTPCLFQSFESPGVYVMLPETRCISSIISGYLREIIFTVPIKYEFPK